MKFKEAAYVHDLWDCIEAPIQAPHLGAKLSCLVLKAMLFHFKPLLLWQKSE